MRELRESYDERARGLLGDVREQITTLSKRVGGSVRADVIDRALAVRMEGQRAVLASRDGTIAFLESLVERRFAIGVLSDCTGEVPALWPDTEYAPLVDCAIFSSEMGIRKPDPRMYAAVLAGLGRQPEETLYVGDGGSSELSGAARFGIRAVLLRIEGEHHARYDEEIGWQGETITDLADVLRLTDEELPTRS